MAAKTKEKGYYCPISRLTRHLSSPLNPITKISIDTGGFSQIPIYAMKSCSHKPDAAKDKYEFFNARCHIVSHDTTLWPALFAAPVEWAFAPAFHSPSTC